MMNQSNKAGKGSFCFVINLFLTPAHPVLFKNTFEEAPYFSVKLLGFMLFLKIILQFISASD